MKKCHFAFESPLKGICQNFAKMKSLIFSKFLRVYKVFTSSFSPLRSQHFILSSSDSAVFGSGCKTVKTKQVLGSLKRKHFYFSIISSFVI